MNKDIKLNTVVHNKSTIALAKLQAIIDSLNQDYKFDLFSGKIWYPFLLIYRTLPEDKKAAFYFSYKGEKYAVVAETYSPDKEGLCCFFEGFKFGFVNSFSGLLACKSEKIAKDVAEQFPELIFDAFFARHFT